MLAGSGRDAALGTSTPSIRDLVPSGRSSAGADDACLTVYPTEPSDALPLVEAVEDVPRALRHELLSETLRRPSEPGVGDGSP